MSPIPYTPPGVSITETVNPSVTVSLASPADICLIGPAGTTTNTETPVTAVDVIALTGTTPQILPTLAELNNDAQLIAVLAVTDVLNPGYGSPAGAGYVVSTDYTVGLGSGPPNGSGGTITRVGAGAIASGTLVQVTYTYLPSDYWNPIRLSDIASVESRFGPSWATAINPTTGQTYYTGIGSQLSMAARLAFSNGVQSVICQPLFSRDTPGDPTTAQTAPSAGAVGSVTTWSDTLYTLRSIPNIGIIVPIVGQDGSNVTDSGMLSIFTAFQTHMVYMNVYNQPMIAIFGEDGTTEGVGNNSSGLMKTMRTTHASTLQSNFPTSTHPISAQCVLINNTVFQIAPPGGTGATVINIGGQYCAAAVAGALGARAASTSLTRQAIGGFQSITDTRTPDDKNADAGSGLMVIEQVNGTVRCRQANTLDIAGGAATAEVSVIRAKFQLIQSIQSLLDNQIIGQIIADANSPIIVASAISSVLALLQQSNIIVGFTAPTAQLTNLNPTTITASFSYQPAFPVNYITISFSLDMTTGAIQING